MMYNWQIYDNSPNVITGTAERRDKILWFGNDNTGKEMNENMRIYYNFIREHSALDGHAPAEEAGINLNLGRNKWVGLIEKAV